MFGYEHERVCFARIGECESHSAVMVAIALARASATRDIIVGWTRRYIQSLKGMMQYT
jgi:hypothetical protein